VLSGGAADLADRNGDGRIKDENDFWGCVRRARMPEFDARTIFLDNMLLGNEMMMLSYVHVKSSRNFRGLTFAKRIARNAS
jgi:hypothetical protein